MGMTISIQISREGLPYHNEPLPGPQEFVRFVTPCSPAFTMQAFVVLGGLAPGNELIRAISQYLKESHHNFISVINSLVRARCLRKEYRTTSEEWFIVLFMCWKQW